MTVQEIDEKFERFLGSPEEMTKLNEKLINCLHANGVKFKRSDVIET